VDSKTLKSLFLPGAAILSLACLLLETTLLPIPHSALDFYYYAVFAVGILMAWRFDSSRVFFILLMTLLAHRALEFFSSGHNVTSGTGRIALEVIAFLIPLNVVIFARSRERGFTVPAVAPYVVLLFFESVFVALLCRPSAKHAPFIFRAAIFGQSWGQWIKLPHLALLSFAVAMVVLFHRFLRSHQPMESGIVWAVMAILIGLQEGGINPLASSYFATAGLILVSSIIENSYVLAFNDELTSLPARRAFNTALLRLEPPYSIAVVDIDHFKKFNDTYGHDTGDQVLRLVAGKLARITGGGKAFRVGGEEFNILFPGVILKEALPHLEQLRKTIEEARFRVRTAPDRRISSRGPDRRTKTRRGLSTKLKDANSDFPSAGELSVTVSIGGAEHTPKFDLVLQVIEAADQALYRAKQAGRNRVETMNSIKPPRSRRRSA